MYEFDKFDPQHIDLLESFRALREGDVIHVEDADWRVTDVTTVKSETDPFIETLRLRPLDVEDPLPSAFIDFRCVCGMVTDDRPEFRVKNAAGEWGYEDEKTDSFGLVSMAERPEGQTPEAGDRFYSSVFDDCFAVTDVGEYEVGIHYNDDRVAVDHVPRIVFTARVENEMYRLIE